MRLFIKSGRIFIDFSFFIRIKVDPSEPGSPLDDIFNDYEVVTPDSGTLHPEFEPEVLYFDCIKLMNLIQELIIGQICPLKRSAK